MIRCVELSKFYGTVRALDSLSLSLERGEIYGLIGPNGAGKTTTMKLIVGLLKPSQGRIFIHGIDMAKDPLGAKRRIGYIPDEPFLYERLTPSELIDLKGSLFDMEEARTEERKARLLDMVGMLEHRDALIEGFPWA